MKRTNKYKGIYKALLVGIILCSVNILSYGVQPLIIEPDDIFFNCETGNANDALPICNDTGIPINSSEWGYADGEKFKFAYIKGQSNRRIKVSFKDDSYSYTGTMHLLITLSYPTGAPGVGSICNFFVANYKCSGTTLCNNSNDHTITLNLAGNLPDIVGKHIFTWTWKIYAIPVDNPNYCAAENTITTTHTYYTLLATPQAPMAEPWSSVLEKACTWAEGQSTPEIIATKITESLYYCGYLYEDAIGSSTYSVFGEPTKINLLQLVSDLNNPTNIRVNCVDMCRAIVIYSNALGVLLNAKRFYSSLGGLLFPVNCIDLIGSNTIVAETNDPFYTRVISNDCRVGGFNFHSFAENNEYKVWDATLRYDIDSDPDNVNNPNNSVCATKTYPSVFNWQLPCKEIESTYLNFLVDDWVKENDNITKNCSEPLDCGYFTNDNFTIQLTY